jgi:hypothetical protein
MDGLAVRVRDAISERWNEIKLHYWRTKGEQTFRACWQCERKTARANWFKVIQDGASIWLECKGCKCRERLEVKA